MNQTVRTFLLVSAAYLLGGSGAALADRDVREAANGVVDGYALEERAGGETQRDDLHAALARPETDEDPAP